MWRESHLTTAAARLAALPFFLSRQRAIQPPQRAVILKPCCLTQVLLTTPLLAALHQSYPTARFDWAVHDWARPAIASHPFISQTINTGSVGLTQIVWGDVRRLVARLRQEQYDTCFIPSRSALLSLVAWLAGIPQRVGLTVQGRGFAQTVRVRPRTEDLHEADQYLALARALGLEARPDVSFFPTDRDRSAATRRLVDEIDWLGDVPLVLLHPGGGSNPRQGMVEKRWPVERFVLLGNHLVRRYNARILVVGAAADADLARTLTGLMSAKAVNLAGQLTLGELGALGEVADLYVGNDTGPTHVAAAVGCPTMALFGPSDPALSAPRGRQVTVLAPQKQLFPFRWEKVLLAAEVSAAADTILAPRQKKKG
ncbi:MAG: glycosyltransferase family 9 protein [Chloroflexi bacterium]|nr:glycosyltransferase family 9 protein [Chloroflexota bacterium]MBP8056820.1 glycosyltransferase family 9 protein [Chloroflexota bacterium]